jgi:thiosulfate dehydrogenase [quinone] large subunit
VVTGLDMAAVRALDRAPRWTLVPLRLYLGTAFLRAALNKVGENWRPWPGWMAGVIQDRLPHSVPLYREFLSAVVLPHVAFFAPAVACAEVTIGCCLVLGLATRAAAVGGILLTLNYLLMNGVMVLLPHNDPLYALGSNDPVFVLGCLAVAVGAAGRALGLDQLLHRRFPHSVLS